MFGGLEKWELVKPFEGNDKVICEALLQWANDGSHAVFDDLFISQSAETKQNFLRVFEEIFRKNNHGSHYDLMTGNKAST